MIRQFIGFSIKKAVRILQNRIMLDYIFIGMYIKDETSECDFFVNALHGMQAKERNQRIKIRMIYKQKIPD